MSRFLWFTVYTCRPRRFHGPYSYSVPVTK